MQAQLSPSRGRLFPGDVTASPNSISQLTLDSVYMAVVC